MSACPFCGHHLTEATCPVDDGREETIEVRHEPVARGAFEPPTIGLAGLNLATSPFMNLIGPEISTVTRGCPTTLGDVWVGTTRPTPELLAELTAMQKLTKDTP